MPRHRKPKSDIERAELLQRFQEQDPTWDHLGEDAAGKRKKKELDELLAVPVEDRFEVGSYYSLFDEVVLHQKAKAEPGEDRDELFARNLSRAQELDRRYFKETRNRSYLRREIYQWVRRQHEPLLRDTWRDLHRPDWVLRAGPELVASIGSSLGYKGTTLLKDAQSDQKEMLELLARLEDIARECSRAGVQEAQGVEWVEPYTSEVQGARSRGAAMHIDGPGRPMGYLPPLMLGQKTNQEASTRGKPVTYYTEEDVAAMATAVQTDLVAALKSIAKDAVWLTKLKPKSIGEIGEAILSRMRSNPEFLMSHVTESILVRIRELIGNYYGDPKAVARAFDQEFRWENMPLDVQITGKFVSPFQFALAVLQVGGTQGWFEQPDTNDEATKELLIKRINTAFEQSGLSIRDFAKRCFPNEIDITAKSKNIHNWLRTGQIAKNELLTFAQAANCSVEYILGAPLKSTSESVWEAVPPTPNNVVQFARKVVTQTGEHLEGLQTVPVLETRQLSDPNTSIQEWQKNPEMFQSLATTNLLGDDVVGQAKFAVAITHDWYEPEFNLGDYVFFATDINPDIGDFCFFARKHEKRTKGKWSIAAGFFHPIGARPVVTDLEDYFDQMEGIALCRKKDGQESRDDYNMRRDDDWEYIPLGVAVDMQRPLLRDRMERASSYTSRMASQYDERGAKPQQNREEGATENVTEISGGSKNGKRA